MATSANKPNAAPFQGKGIFVTTATSQSALQYAGQADWVAVPPETSAASVQQLRNAGFRVIVWEQVSSTAGVKAVSTLGADGYIAGAESQDQLDAALANQSQIGVPKALVTNNFMAHFPGEDWVAVPEAYPNKDPNTALANVVTDSYNLGALVVIPLLGVYDSTTENTTRIPVGVYQSDMDKLGLKVTAFAIYTTDQADPVYVASVLGIKPGTGGAPEGSTVTVSQPVNTQPVAASPPAGGSLDFKIGAPPGLLNLSGNIGSTLEPYGLILSTAEGRNNNYIVQMSGGSYQSVNKSTGEVSVAGYWGDGKGGGYSKDGFGNPNGVPVGSPGSPLHPETPQPVAGQSTSQFPWHANANWAPPSQELLNDIRANNPNVESYGTILEARPADDGSGAYILRMSDGSYERYNPATHSATLAGNWNKDQWDDFQKAQVAASAGSSTDNPPDSGPITSTSGNTPGAHTEWDKGVIDQALNAVGDSDPEAKAILKKANNDIKVDKSESSGGGGGGNPDPMAVTIAAGTTNYEAPAQLVGTGGYDPGAQGTGGCFIAGTKVLTSEGDKPIEEIKLGDAVQTWNMEKQAAESTTVTDLLAHHDRYTIVIETENGKKVTTTVEHPFWTGSAWVPAGILRANESTVFGQDGQPQKVTAVSDGPKANVYNFHVAAPAHNYFVEGLLVHNLKSAGM
jgi:hypothetical protein